MRSETQKIVYVRFRCKMVKENFAIFGHKGIFAQERVKERTRVYVRKSCLDRPAAELGNFHSYPISSLSQELVWTLTPAPGSVVPVNDNALSTPISVLFREPVRTKLNQVLAVVWSLFCPYSMDVEAVLHLRNFFVSRVRNSSLILGLDFFLFRKAK